jgi:hypothetical protein
MKSRVILHSLLRVGAENTESARDSLSNWTTSQHGIWLRVVDQSMKAGASQLTASARGIGFVAVNHVVQRKCRRN